MVEGVPEFMCIHLHGLRQTQCGGKMMLGQIGGLQAQVFALAQMRRLVSVTGEELAGSIGWTRNQASQVLSRLARRKLAARVRPDLYLLPPGIPAGGCWTPDSFLALSVLMADRGAQYQICGSAAFHHHGWLDQVPNRLDVYNTAISGSRLVGAASFRLTQVQASRLGDTESFRTPEGVTVTYSSRCRSLVDALNDWSRFGSFPAVRDWIGTEVAREPGMASRIVRCALTYGNIGSLRRLGVILEDLGVSRQILGRVASALPPTSAWIPLRPDLPGKGPVNRRWWVRMNG